MGFSTVIVNTFFYGLYSDTNATKLLRLSAKQKVILILTYLLDHQLNQAYPRSI